MRCGFKISWMYFWDCEFSIFSDPGELVEEFTDESVYPPVRKFRCQVCLKCFGQKHHCKRHVGEAHFLSEKVECQNCGKFFKNKRCAQEHFRYCNAQMIWRFRWLPKFTSVSVFMFLDPGEFVEPFTDQSVYPAVEKFRCRACGKSFGRLDNCKRHIKSAHLEADQVACLKCGKYYKNQRCVREHYRVCVNLWKCIKCCALSTWLDLKYNFYEWYQNVFIRSRWLCWGVHGSFSLSANGKVSMPSLW